MALREALIAAALSLAPAVAAAQVERFAVVVGDDAGMADDLPLRWAEADAARVAAVLQEVGGVRPENLVLLRGANAGAVRRALIAVNERVRTAGRDTVLFVYYSGHADATALHLGPTALELAELEGLVRGSAATFRLLVLDACRSGALTRVKGGTPIPPFELRLGERVPGEGAVFLTSSSASEDSQESDEIRGSFFTHALISGLLGAADADGDGRVTLDEAYRHAYEATVRSSSRTVAGLQHPTFQYDVRGQGDVVLSTLPGDDRARAWLAFPDGATWLVFQGSPDGPVVGEIGRGDRIRRLNVRAGTYYVRGRGADGLFEGAQAAPPGATVAVDPGRLQRTAYARLVRKGLGDARAARSFELEGRTRAALASEGSACSGVGGGATLALRPLTLHARVAYCQSHSARAGLRATAEAWELELGATHVWDLPGVSLEAGVVAGGAVLQQRFRTGGVAPPRTTAALQLSPVASISRDLGQRSYAFASVAAATYLFRVQDSADGATSLRPSFAVRVAAGAGFRM
jgi:caspase domain-containing protein